MFGRKRLTFNAIDVETANADRASICQIGIVQVRRGKVVDRWQTLVDPEGWFDPWNVRVHGITEQDVSGSPTLPRLERELRRRLRGGVLVSHSSFDRVAFARAMDRYRLRELPVTWLDSAAVARRAWPERLGRGGYGLKNLAEDLDISFSHHHALEDARAAAEVVLQACRAADMDIDGWLERVQRPVSGSASAPSARQGNPDGALFGETLVFTGALSINRREAAELAASAGCDVATSVNGKTTILVVGTQRMYALSGYDKSRKHRDAEARIEDGADIRILSESDFSDLIGGF